MYKPRAVTTNKNVINMYLAQSGTLIVIFLIHVIVKYKMRKKFMNGIKLMVLKPDKKKK